MRIQSLGADSNGSSSFDHQDIDLACNNHLDTLVGSAIDLFDLRAPVSRPVRDYSIFRSIEPIHAF